MYRRSSNKKNEKGQGLVEYALILVLVAIVVIAALMILGPIIGNVFSKINSSLSGVGAGGSGAAAAPAAPAGLGCSDIHPDGYATGPGYGWDCYSPTFGAYDVP
ncbi:MAG: Flp family type IVb pilin [Chloroflexi bacterium]|nr:Flp family type IVb pilin [Chloroflexota bacterium]